MTVHGGAGNDTPTQFLFKMRATPKDATGYYYPNWDHAESVEVSGSTKQEAINKADAMLGPCPRGRGWYWTFHVDKIEEVRA